ncbi:hypothetical protein DRN85_08450 [Methanosarcinales archaeon]|nr:MAG: hypothetical protein DRN85_08450 [Methanosarcinales archaeon]
MDEKERYREVEKRERLVQTFLIISGFLVAYTGEEAQRFTVLIFSMYLISIILYYVFVSRTNNTFAVDWLAIASSCYYSLLILIFLSSQPTSKLSSSYLYFSFSILTAVFTFSLLSPDTSEQIVNRYEKFLENLNEKHLKYIKVILVIINIVVMVGIILYYAVAR